MMRRRARRAAAHWHVLGQSRSRSRSLWWPGPRAGREPLRLSLALVFLALVTVTVTSLEQAVS